MSKVLLRDARLVSSSSVLVLTPSPSPSPCHPHTLTLILPGKTPARFIFVLIAPEDDAAASVQLATAFAGIMLDDDFCAVSYESLIHLPLYELTLSPTLTLWPPPSLASCSMTTSAP